MMEDGLMIGLKRIAVAGVVVNMALATLSYASPITFTFAGKLDEPYGAVSAGDSYSFSYTFDDAQAPVPQSGVPILDNSLYVFDTLALTIGTETVTASGETPSDDAGTIRVVNDRVAQGDGYFLRSAGGPAGFVGSIGGLIVNEILLEFRDPTGSMFSSTGLITDKAIFGLADLSLSFFRVGCIKGATSGGDCGNGGDDPSANDFFHIESPVANPPGVVPIPATLPLFATGLGVLGFFGWRRRKVANETDAVRALA
jgi:hypothetical protein